MPKKKGRGRGRGRGQQQPGAPGGDHGAEMGAVGGPPGMPPQQYHQQPQYQQQQQHYQEQQQRQQHYQQPQRQQQQHYQQQQQRQQQPQQYQQQQQRQQQRQQQPQQYQQQQRQPQPQQQQRRPTPPQQEYEESPSPSMHQEPPQEPEVAPQEPEVAPPVQREAPVEEVGASAAVPEEMALVEEFRRQVQVVASNLRRPPKRPDAGGNAGRPIQLIVNHMNIILRGQEQYIFMNDVEITIMKSSSGKTPGPAPQGQARKGGGKQKGDLSKEKREIVMKQFLFRHPEFASRFPAYDGNKNVYTNQQLTKPGGQSFDFSIDFDNRGSPAEIRVTVKEAQQIDLEVLRGYVARDFRGRDGSTLNMPQDQLRGLTAIFRAGLEAANFMSMGRAVINRNFEGEMRCGPYNIHDGMFLSVRPQMWSIRLNVDKTQVVLRQQMSLVDFVLKERQAMNRGRGDPHGPFQPHEHKAIEKKLRGMRVVGDHYMSGGRKYSRKFTVQSLSRDSAERHMIRDLNQSVAQYHMENYRIRLQYPHWPCVCTNREKKTMTPMELFALVPFQRAPNDDPEITREIIRHAAIKPHDRLNRIQRMVNGLKMDKTVHTFLSKYLIDIDPKLLQTNGRVLPPPVIEYDGQQVRINPNQTGSWRADRARFVRAATIEDIYVANFSRNDVSRGISTLLQCGRNLGMQLPQFNPGMVQSGMRWHEGEMRKIFQECLQYWKGKLDRCMLIVILPPFDDSAYGTIKRFGDDEFGVPTQCIKDRTVGKMNPQTATNILLKMNAKLNGVNWKVQGVSHKVTFQPIVEPFIVFGADVTHPSPTGNRKLARSIAAVVASMDKGCTLYKSEVSFQESTRGEGSTAIVELIQDLKNMVQRLLRKYYRTSGEKPHRIFFYRDGVSDGQFKDVIEREVAAIQQACTSLEQDYQPGITFIVVQKRHHTRLFPTNQEDQTRSGNVPAGTIVDRDIVHPREFDFFLCSHDGIQGTSKPCHYHVLWDDNKWTSNDLQLFTYYLCHCYARCTRSVSYPAPTYYSHLAAFRAREVHGDLVDSSDSGSTVSGATARSGDGAVAGDPKNKTPMLDKQYWM